MVVVDEQSWDQATNCDNRRKRPLFHDHELLDPAHNHDQRLRVEESQRQAIHQREVHLWSPFEHGQNLGLTVRLCCREIHSPVIWGVLGEETLCDL